MVAAAVHQANEMKQKRQQDRREEIEHDSISDENPFSGSGGASGSVDDDEGVETDDDGT
eukprot:CAMPEP_0197237960 /NCGR_PEP_ID=MMETSP1429-20130617/4623_1 /TAXON_ID=49237 /ORGANISM="Chaetoceros  sp., Strain UNC1202" /LENGTH=58 /DNA_ID=CAMNT_0042697045 /DNA_START=166 /DNA_END=342 /DNA_ORIENTATION=+